MAGEFSKDRSRAGGLTSQCRACRSRALAVARRRDVEQSRRRERERQAQHRGREKQRTPAWQPRDEHARARHAVQEAVRWGKMAKPTACSACHASEPPHRIHGHHHLGYDRPLDVVWLCSICHGEQHRRSNPAASERLQDVDSFGPVSQYPLRFGVRKRILDKALPARYR